MLVDYFEEEAGKIKKMLDRIHDLNQQYRDLFDPDIREQMYRMKKSVKREQAILMDETFSNIQEFRFLKKYFPSFFDELKNDEFLGKSVSRMEWLIGFKELKEGEAQKEFEKIKKSRKELREAKKFMLKWVGRIDPSSIEATWKPLKGEIEEGMDKEDVLEIIENIDSDLRRKGWLVLMNEPFVYGRIYDFIEKIKNARAEESNKKFQIQKSKGQSTSKEYEAEQNYRDAVKKRKHTERMLEHFLKSNPSFLDKIKKKKTVWRDKTTSDFMKKFSERVNVKKINETIWIKEMKEKFAI